jgi:hypothetical protein
MSSTCLWGLQRGSAASPSHWHTPGGQGGQHAGCLGQQRASWPAGRSACQRAIVPCRGTLSVIFLPCKSLNAAAFLCVLPLLAVSPMCCLCRCRRLPCRMASRYLIVFVTFLPFAFWSMFGWVTIPIMAVYTFLLVGLENIGIQIEEPYSVLPLHRFSLGIKRAVELTLINWRPAERMAECAAMGGTAHFQASPGLPANGLAVGATGPGGVWQAAPAAAGCTALEQDKGMWRTAA